MSLILLAGASDPAREIQIEELALLVHPDAAVAWDRDGCEACVSAADLEYGDIPRIDLYAARGRLENGLAALVVGPRGGWQAAIMVFVCDPVPHWRSSSFAGRMSTHYVAAASHWANIDVSAHEAG